jgi:hypothetical protein
VVEEASVVVLVATTALVVETLSLVVVVGLAVVVLVAKVVETTVVEDVSSELEVVVGVLEETEVVELGLVAGTSGMTAFAVQTWSRSRAGTTRELFR